MGRHQYLNEDEYEVNMKDFEPQPGEYPVCHSFKKGGVVAPVAGTSFPSLVPALADGGLLGRREPWGSGPKQVFCGCEPSFSLGSCR